MNIPLVLTFTRLIISPFVPAVLLVFLLPTAGMGMHIFLAGLFALMALTDFFDGYLARRLQQETVIGRVLDPIADKMFIMSTLVALVYLDKVFWFWAIIIIGREILIMGLRELALMHQFSLPVSQWGKYKSALQYVYFTGVIAGCSCYAMDIVCGVMLGATLFSAYQYVREFISCYSEAR